jgi:hypothetical protein
LIAAVAIVVLALIGKRFPDGSVARILIGVAETIAFGFVIVSMLVRIRRLDELYQRIHLIAIAAAFGLGGLVLTAIEFLSQAGVHVPPLGLWLWFFMVIVWGLGVVVVSRRYR